MEDERLELKKMLVRFYNMQAECSLRADSDKSLRLTSRCLDEANNDVVMVKNHIKKWVEEHKEEGNLSSRFEDCMTDFKNDNKVEANVVNPMPVAGDNQVQYGMGLLEQAVVNLISQMNSEKIEQSVMGSVEDKVRDFIKEEYGTIERKITTVVDGVPRQMAGIQHDKFETVLKFVANDEPVYLSGPAGSGKNVLCKQVADALGLDFYFTNAVTQEYKLTGFTDAMGNYQESQFYKAFKNGGIFMLDEMDASIPEVLVILNAAIANRYFDFPAPIGYVEAHPDFRVIAAGNTLGHGADFEYVGRSQLDGASLDRFAVVKVDYSEAIENNVAGDKELAQFCRDFRKSAKKNGLQVIVSYRAIGRLAKMLQIMDIEEALDTCLIKGLEKDDINIIANGIRRDTKYKDAMKKIADNM